MKKKILITGAAGFIGFHLIKTLIKNKNFSITIIDNLSLRDKGFQIKTHKGKDGGQEVFHFHLHLLSNS